MDQRQYSRCGMDDIPKTSRATTYDKSAELGRQIEALEEKITVRSPSSFVKRIRPSYFVVALIGFPLVVFIALFGVRPSFVLTRTKEGVVRDRRKLVRWTLVCTLVGYAAVYLYACYASSPPVVSFSPEILKS